MHKTLFQWNHLNETGDLLNEQEVLNWLTHQVHHEEIEEITNEMLDILIKQKKHLAVLFCKNRTPFSVGSKC
jgi:hypothetical protein